MKRQTLQKRARELIDRHGILLVYPIQNRPEPASLWSGLHPRSAMRWEWDNGGDNRVAELWHLRARLSESSEVVYAKWYQGRATFFSRALFPSVLAALEGADHRLSVGARRQLSLLEEDSPQSTKQLKKRFRSMGGATQERAFETAIKALWDGLFAVGFGEVDDGAFPSLAVGATSVLFADLWQQAQQISAEVALAQVSECLGPQSPFLRHLQRLRKRSRTGTNGKRVIHFEDLVKR